MTRSSSLTVYSVTVTILARLPSTGTSYTACAKLGLPLTSSTKQAQLARAVARLRRRVRRCFRCRSPSRMAARTIKESSSGVS